MGGVFPFVGEFETSLVLTILAKGGSKPMLDRYIGARMVSILNINNGIKELTRGYQN
jgi:hypothetical protein